MSNGEDRLDRIEALLERLVETQTQTQQQINQLAQTQQEGIADVVGMIGNLGHQQGETERQLQSLITSQERDRQDWQEQRRESNQQVQALIDMARDNSRDHADFRAFIRGMQLELQRLWQRLAG